MSRYAVERWRAFDVETTGESQDYALQPWSPRGYLTCHGTARFLGKQITSSTTEANAAQSKLIEQAGQIFRGDPVLVGWNVAFDAAWLIALGFREQVMRATWLDGMLLWKHHYRIPESDINTGNRKKYGLKDAVREFLPQLAGYEAEINYAPQTDKEWVELIKYLNIDLRATLYLTRMFWQRLKQEDPQQLRNALIESRAIPEVADHHNTGIHIDLDWADDLDARVAKEHAEHEAKLISLGATPKVLASPSQLSKLLYEQWELPILKHTPKGAPSTDKEALHELALFDDRASHIRAHRELGNLRTKFIGKIVESCEYNELPVSHPTANIAGTYTGRLTFSSFIGKNKDKRQTGFAIHQMSGKKDYRKLVRAPSGFVMIEWDAAGQEYRWMAIESEDQTMLDLCQPGEDPHSSMGSSIQPAWEYRELQASAKAGDDDAYAVRRLGKVGNLSCQYRIGKPKLLSTARVQYNLPMDMSEASMIHDTYHRKYPGVRKYWQRAIKDAKINGYATTLAGRKVRLNVDWSDKATNWMYESTAVNFPIQGAGADQKFLAIATLQPLWKKYNTKFYFELHDGLYAIAPAKHAMTVALKGRDMLNDMNYWGAWRFQPPIPLPWDVKIGPTWGELEEQD